jgi:hypothetical protein
LHLPEKNGLPFDQALEMGSSPLGELLQIDKGEERTGFEFCGSGGNPVINGFVLPDLRSRKTTSATAAEGATFKTCQTVTNWLNAVMEQICESTRPMAVFLAENVLPVSKYDQNLQKDIGPVTEQVVYMGVYDVRWCTQEEPLDPSALIETMHFYQEFYPDLKGAQLRF